MMTHSTGNTPVSTCFKSDKWASGAMRRVYLHLRETNIFLFPQNIVYVFWKIEGNVKYSVPNSL